MTQRRAVRLTEAQRKILERFANGDTVGSRLNFMFCDKASRYAQVFISDFSVAPSNTLSALFKAGYLGAGYIITPAGRAALQASDGGE